MLDNTKYPKLSYNYQTNCLTIYFSKLNYTKYYVTQECFNELYGALKNGNFDDVYENFISTYNGIVLF